MQHADDAVRAVALEVNVGVGLRVAVGITSAAAGWVSLNVVKRVDRLRVDRRPDRTT